MHLLLSCGRSFCDYNLLFLLELLRAKTFM